MNEKQIQKAISWGIKASTLIISIPATWAMAWQLYPELPVLMRSIVSAAAVGTVDLTLLSAWLAMDAATARQDATDRVRYAAVAWAMYAALLWVGFAHEGLSGLVFRVAFGVALADATWATVSGWVSYLTSRADRGEDIRVKRFDRKLSRAEAKAARRADNEVKLATIEADKKVRLAKLEADTMVRMEGVKLSNRADMAKVKKEYQQDTKADKSRNVSASTGHLDYPIEDARAARDDKMRRRLERDAAKIRQHLLDNPDATFEELADILGVSAKTVSRRRDWMMSEGLWPMGHNGNGHRGSS